MINKSSAGDIHIGLVLAGAVTAGSYTAGVLDYLLNTLDLWEEEYQKNRTKVPRPNVIIDTMTGASAGSMAAAVTLLALATKQYKSKITEDEISFENNLLYKTWVEFGLKDNEKIIDKLFSINDLKDNEVKSLLNTSFIDDLIVELVSATEKAELQELPGYINKNIEILMTLSNLRGIPIDLSFSNDTENVAHTMSYHKAFAHFQYHKKDPEDHSTLPLDLKEHLDLFLDCSRASGAFPIGLKSIPFKGITKAYIEANLKEIFGEDLVAKPNVSDTYEFLAVDGGMTNNEPMAEAIRILRNRNESDKTLNELRELIREYNISEEELSSTVIKNLRNENPIILIDPFPNYIKDSANENYNIEDNSITTILPQLYKTLRNQVLFKERDILDLFKSDSSQSMIWPTRYSKDEKLLSNPIASGALGGFAGFFSKSFRHHDYILGMKNCQNFIRYYFTQNLADADWTEEQINRFSFIDKEGNEKLPIIPDFRITGIEENGSWKKFKHSLAKNSNFPTFPQIDHDELIEKQLKPKLKSRINEVLKILMKSKKETTSQKRNYPFAPKKSLVSTLSNAITPTRLVRYFIRKLALNRIVPSMLNYISYTLHQHDLLKDNPKPPDTRMNK